VNWKSRWILKSSLDLVHRELGLSLPLQKLLESDSYSLLMSISGVEGADRPLGAASVVSYWLDQLIDYATLFSLKAEPVGMNCFQVWLEVASTPFPGDEHPLQSTLFATFPWLWHCSELCSVSQALNLCPADADWLSQAVADAVTSVIVLPLTQWDWGTDPIYVVEPAKPVRKPIPKRTRFDVLHRADYTCQACGAKAADGAELHIDHIHPVSKGGTNDPANLQALCRDCNLGKGARVL
jgi:hypothetical protein